MNRSAAQQSYITDMTLDQFLQYAIYFVSLVGALFGFWKFIDSKLGAIQDDSAATKHLLADYRVHVAEHYVSKAGHREATATIMEAINSVRNAVEGLGTRIDRMYDSSRNKE